MGRFTSGEKGVVLRILDANANRCAEGLRVVEEIIRFAAGDKTLLVRIKEIRHAVRTGMGAFTSAPYRFRDSRADVGRTCTTDSELLRGSMENIARANFARAEEALRVLEEFGKLTNVEAAEGFKALRFEMYELERIFFEGAVPRGKLPDPPFLYAILDRAIVAAADVPAAAAALVEGGVDILQYRAKGVPADEQRADLLAVIPAAAVRAVPVIVNDDPELALETGAHGVHLGARDPAPAAARRILGRDRIVGVSVHSVQELERIDPGVVDYIAVGAIFASPTKPDAPVAGVEFIDAVRGLVACTLVAIGGIDERTIDRVLDHGADGVALVSALLTGDIGKKCFTFRSIIDKRRTAAG
ncbi:MAG TPA: thiamine phosphate synthase [Patescibacteria group bacterium]|nr:thiamine phosphate synthase [Patescibacteria group bacterium]